MKKANDDIIVFECDCGSNTFVSYEARIMGYTVKYPEGLDIRKMPEHMVEIHGLTMCAKCSKLIDCVVLQKC